MQPNWLNAPGSGGIYPQDAVMFGRREGAIGKQYLAVEQHSQQQLMRELAEAAVIAGEANNPNPLGKRLTKTSILCTGNYLAKVAPIEKFLNHLNLNSIDNNTVTEKLANSRLPSHLSRRLKLRYF